MWEKNTYMKKHWVHLISSARHFRNTYINRTAVSRFVHSKMNHKNCHNNLPQFPPCGFASSLQSAILDVLPDFFEERIAPPQGSASLIISFLGYIQIIIIHSSLSSSHRINVCHGNIYHQYTPVLLASIYQTWNRHGHYLHWIWLSLVGSVPACGAPSATDLAPPGRFHSHGATPSSLDG